MKIFSILVLICLAVTIAVPTSKNDPKTLHSQKVGFSNCAARSCPPWKCQDDSAVIHGYCCHCPGWEYDYVPVPCYPDLRCPVSPEPLCSDYNFMMDCCCTGP